MTRQKKRAVGVRERGTICTADNALANDGNKNDKICILPIITTMTSQNKFFCK